MLELSNLYNLYKLYFYSFVSFIVYLLVHAHLYLDNFTVIQNSPILNLIEINNMNNIK